MNNEIILKKGKKEKEKIKNNEDLNNSDVQLKMTNYVKNGRRYYTTKREALAHQRKGNRIYYDAFEGAYYIVSSLSKESFWGR